VREGWAELCSCPGRGGAQRQKKSIQNDHPSVPGGRETEVKKMIEWLQNGQTNKGGWSGSVGEGKKERRLLTHLPGGKLKCFCLEWQRDKRRPTSVWTRQNIRRIEPVRQAGREREEKRQSHTVSGYKISSRVRREMINFSRKD